MELRPWYGRSPKPTLAVLTELPDLAEYEVRVFDTKNGRRLVAAVEIVSLGNKDQPEHRRAFVAKCAALLRKHVCVSIVDLVTARDDNLYCDLMDHLGLQDPSFDDGPSALYAVTSRWARQGQGAAGELVAAPGVGSAAADAAALADRFAGGASRAGSELRGNKPQPAHPVVAQSHRGDVNQSASQTRRIQVASYQRIFRE